MTLLQAILLGILQGITEFLPISSSGHLVLGETLLNLDASNLKDFDVTLHVGTLLAIILYFRRELLDFKLWPWLLLGSLPAVFVGLVFEDAIDAAFRNASSVGIMMILMGFLFQIPDRFFKQNKKLNSVKVLLIGIAQAAAIIPGVSRSGATILAGTLLGLKREEAARFSFLLGSIAIAGAGLLTSLDLESTTLPASQLLAGALAAFLSGLLSVSWLMRFLKSHSLQTFGYYRLFIGGLIVMIALL